MDPHPAGQISRTPSETGELVSRIRFAEKLLSEVELRRQLSALDPPDQDAGQNLQPAEVVDGSDPAKDDGGVEDGK